jgi:hypothetical protein
MAKGGLVTQPTHAIVGEAGPEAVIPLAQLPELMSRLVQHVRSSYAPKKETAAAPPVLPSNEYGPPRYLDPNYVPPRREERPLSREDRVFDEQQKRRAAMEQAAAQDERPASDPYLYDGRRGLVGHSRDYVAEDFLSRLRGR